MIGTRTRGDNEDHSLGIIELCLSEGRGGLEQYAARLAVALGARGHRITVAARDGSEFARRVEPLPALALRHSRYRPWRGARRLAELGLDARIIHIHRSADLPLAAVTKHLAGNQPILVYTRHMAITRDRHQSLVHRWLHGQVDLLLAVTERVAEAARERLPLPPERIRVLPLGVMPAPPPADCRRVRPAGRAFVVGCFSRIERPKGQHELLAALAQIVGRGIDAAALIAGPVMDPDYARELQATSNRLGITDRVHFPGVFPDARPAMGCCDAVVMPSAAETFGLVLVEGMQMGVPVVATAAGGVSEILRDGETGLTYPPGNAAALAAQLERLAKTPEFARTLAEAGRAEASEHYDWETHLQRLEKIFYELVQKRDSASAR